MSGVGFVVVVFPDHVHFLLTVSDFADNSIDSKGVIDNTLASLCTLTDMFKGIIHTFFQMPLYLSLQYGRNNSSLNVCECPSISL